MFGKKRIKELEADVASRDVRIKDLEEKLTLRNDITGLIGSVDAMSDGAITSSSILGALKSHDVAMYVDDYYGGKVIEQESHPVTVLDENGKATYHKTKQKPDKGFNYKLERLVNPFEEVA